MDQQFENWEMNCKSHLRSVHLKSSTYRAISTQEKGSKPVVLIVEDNFLIREVYQRHLRDFNCEVDLAIDVENALKQLNIKQYHLILMDIGLPEGDGRDLTRLIRHTPESINRLVPIVGITAHTGVEAHQSCIEAGMNEVFLKPLTLESLRGILEKFVGFQSNRALNEDIINFSEIVALLGSEEEAAAILEDFVTQLPKEQAQLMGMYKDKQWNVLYKYLHNLQSGMVYCGTTRLQKYCEALGRSLTATGKIDYALVDNLFEQFLEEIITVIDYYQTTFKSPDIPLS